MGPLTSLRSITELTAQQATKTGKSFFLSLSVSQASTRMVEAIKCEKTSINHWVLHSASIILNELGLVAILPHSMYLHGSLYFSREVDS